MTEIVCQVRIEGEWTIFETGEPLGTGCRFSAVGVEQRGGAAALNDTRRALAHVRRDLGRSDLPAGTRLRFEGELPWPQADDLLRSSTLVLTDEVLETFDERRKVDVIKAVPA